MSVRLGLAVARTCSPLPTRRSLLMEPLGITLVGLDLVLLSQKVAVRVLKESDIGGDSDQQEGAEDVSPKVKE